LSEVTGLALVDQELAGTTDLKTINLGADDLLEIGFVQGEQNVSLSTEGRQQNGTIFGFGEDQELVEGEFDGDKDEVRKQGSPPIGSGAGAELADVALGLLYAIGGGEKPPAEGFGVLKNIAGSAFGGTGGGEQDAGVEEEFHFFDLALVVRLKAAISA
jgi:hypothetical protein